MPPHHPTALHAAPAGGHSRFPGVEDHVGPVGFIALANTPAPVLTKPSSAIRATLANTAIQQKLRSLGAVVVASTPTDYREWLKQDHARWTPLIKDEWALP